MRLPVSEQQQTLMTELAVALYARGILSFGKARDLTSLDRVEFERLLGRRDIPRHYTEGASAGLCHSTRHCPATSLV